MAGKLEVTKLFSQNDFINLKLFNIDLMDWNWEVLIGSSIIDSKFNNTQISEYLSIFHNIFWKSNIYFINKSIGSLSIKEFVASRGVNNLRSIDKLIYLFGTYDIIHNNKSNFIVHQGPYDLSSSVECNIVSPSPAHIEMNARYIIYLVMLRKLILYP